MSIPKDWTMSESEKWRKTVNPDKDYVWNHVASFFIRRVSREDSSRTRFSFYFSVFQYLALECLFWLLLRTCTWVLKLIQQLDTFGMIYSRYDWSAKKQRPWPWNVHNWCVKNRNNDNRCSYHQRATSIWFICFIYLYICFTLAIMRVSLSTAKN